MTAMQCVFTAVLTFASVILICVGMYDSGTHGVGGAGSDWFNRLRLPHAQRDLLPRISHLLPNLRKDLYYVPVLSISFHKR